MTKEDFAKQIIETVENSGDQEEAFELIFSMLSLLHPVDRAQFAQWGYPEQRVSEGICWD